MLGQVPQFRWLPPRAAVTLERLKDPMQVRPRDRTQMHLTHPTQVLRWPAAVIQVRLNHRTQVRLRERMRVLRPIQLQVVDIRVHLNHRTQVRPRARTRVLPLLLL